MPIQCYESRVTETEYDHTEMSATKPTLSSSCLASPKTDKTDRDGREFISCINITAESRHRDVGLPNEST